MTTNHPSTVEVDLYKFMQDFHAFDAARDDDDNRIDTRPTKLHSGTRAVAFCIAAHWNRDKRKAWPTIETIAFEAEVSPATVKRAIKALEDAGWLLVEHRRKPQSNIYRLASPIAASSSTTDTGTAHHEPLMAHHEPLNGSPRATEGLTMSPKLRSELTNGTNHVNHNVSPEHVSHDARASRFEEWWSAYPRHEKKPKARAAYAAAVQRGVSEQVLIDGALRYAQDPNRSDGQYTKFPETWLVNEGWNDDPLPVRNTSTGGRPSITESVGGTLAAGQRLMQQYATTTEKFDGWLAMGGITRSPAPQNATLSLESSATTVIDTVDEDVRRIERCDSIGPLDFEETIAARERLAAGIPWQEVAGDVVKERESKLEPSVRFQRAVVERCKAMLGADEVKLRLPEYRQITEAFKSGADVESVAAAIRESRDRIPA